MQKEENEVLEEIEIIDDFDDEIPVEPQKKQNEIEAEKNEISTMEEGKVDPAPAMTQLQEELRRETLTTHQEEQHMDQPSKPEPEVMPADKETQEEPKSTSSEPTSDEIKGNEEVESEPKIDEELIHSSLENTMLLNKELLKAAAAETVKETKDESKENKKGIIFVIIIFGCLIVFTALIPFILKMFE